MVIAVAVAATIAGLVWKTPAAAELPRVLVTVKPVHSLVAGVMADLGRPALLLTGGESPHSYVMRPSGARKVARARLIFRLGGGLERFLDRPIRALAPDATVVALATAAELTLLRGRDDSRDSNAPDASDDSDPDDSDMADDDSAVPPESVDPHVWLDPANARRIVALAAAELGRIDPANAARYAENAKAVRARIAALDRALAADLAPIRRLPYVVFHDGYQYFERRYDLARVGSITIHSGRKPGARRLRQIRRLVVARGAGCVFAEPQFEPALVATMVEGTGAGTGVLDPLGADLPAGPDLYFILMRRLAESLKRCLVPGS